MTSAAADPRDPAATLIRGPVRAHLVALTVPMIWGILAMMAFNLTDTWFVAQLGARELAAMSFTFPVVMVLLSVGIGLMAGTSSVLAIALGRGEVERARRVTTDAIVLSVLLSVLMSALGLATIDPLFAALGAEPEIRPLIADYMVVWYAGFVFVLVPMVALGAVRATGDSKLQSNVMILAALINLILDPLLIFGLAGMPRLELQGAAAASVIARAATLAISYWAIRHRVRLLTAVVPSRAELVESWRSVLHVGLPAAGTNVIIPAATAVVLALVAGSGTDAVAGFGAATRIEPVTLVVFYAMSAIIGPFVGQNLGAGRHDRIVEAMRLCVVFCITWGLAIAAVLAVAAEPLIRQFSTDPAVVEVGVAYLLIVPLSFGPAGIVMIVNAAFNGLRRPLPAVCISLTRMVVLYLPLAALGDRLLGVTGIFVAACAANILSGCIAWVSFRRMASGPGRP